MFDRRHLGQTYTCTPVVCGTVLVKFAPSFLGIERAVEHEGTELALLRPLAAMCSMSTECGGQGEKHDEWESQRLLP